MNYGKHRRETASMKEAEKAFENESGAALNDDVDELLIRGKETVPRFPFNIFCIALIKDILDGLSLTGVGLILTVLATIPISLILFFWLFNKIHGGWWKKGVIKWLWKRYFLTIIVEFIPGFQLVPATTIFVLMAHHKENKVVKLFNRMLDKLASVKEDLRDSGTVLKAAYEIYQEETQVDGMRPRKDGDKSGDKTSRPANNPESRGGIWETPEAAHSNTTSPSETYTTDDLINRKNPDDQTEVNHLNSATNSQPIFRQQPTNRSESDILEPEELPGDDTEEPAQTETPNNDEDEGEFFDNARRIT